MARELKFRVWDNVDYMSSPFTLQDVQAGKIKFTTDCQIMQFTGLLDKNWKEIYEGDILESVSGYKYAVEYKDGCFMWCNEPIVYDEDEEEAMRFSMNADWSTIIGNIYENPELIKC